MIASLLERHPRFANWLYGFTPPERGTVVLVHRRVYIVPARLGWIFARRAGRAARRLDQLCALARLRAHLPARRARPCRHGAYRAQPRAHRDQRRARRAGVRRRVGAVSALPRRPRRVRPARDPRAPRRLGLAARGRRPGRRHRRSGARRAGDAARLAAARPRDARDPFPARACSARGATSSPRRAAWCTRARSARRCRPSPARRWPARSTRPRPGSDDFAGLRDYQSSDSPRHIAWKAVARSDKLLTKQFAGDAAAELWLDARLLPQV